MFFRGSLKKSVNPLGKKKTSSKTPVLRWGKKKRVPEIRYFAGKKSEFHRRTLHAYICTQPDFPASKIFYILTLTYARNTLPPSSSTFRLALVLLLYIGGGYFRVFVEMGFFLTFSYLLGFVLFRGGGCFGLFWFAFWFVQSNPNSHLSSAKTFDEMGLPPALLKGVQAMG